MDPKLWEHQSPSLVKLYISSTSLYPGATMKLLICGLRIQLVTKQKNLSLGYSSVKQKEPDQIPKKQSLKVHSVVLTFTVPIAI